MIFRNRPFLWPFKEASDEVKEVVSRVTSSLETSSSLASEGRRLDRDPNLRPLPPLRELPSLRALALLRALRADLWDSTDASDDAPLDEGRSPRLRLLLRPPDEDGRSRPPLPSFPERRRRRSESDRFFLLEPPVSRDDRTESDLWNEEGPFEDEDLPCP